MRRSSSKTKKKKKQPVRAIIEDDVDECSSDITQLSVDEDDARSIFAESNINGDSVEKIDLTEDKFKEALENATHKNVSIRIEALKGLHSIFASHYVPGLLDNWTVTAADVIERCLRKKGDEGKRALNLGILIALQLGADFGPIVTKYPCLLKEWVADWTLTTEFRTECATALSLYTYLTTEELEDIIIVLNIFHDIWSKPKCTAQPALYCACLNAWILLLLRMSNKYLESALTNDLPLLCDNLENASVEVRRSSGEILCVLYELARTSPLYAQDGFEPDSLPRTLELLEQISRDSVKYQAKRDRRLERASFRDIYAAVKDNEAPNVKVKFGTENMILDSWSSKLCYDVICNYLHGGMNTHLQENIILRDIFGLGEPILNPVTSKISKLERQILNQSIGKARSLVRGKQRDKRVATFS